MEEQTVDVLVAGTGAAGLAAAITAAREGLQVLVVESTDRWGGSSSMSGGGMWMPTNPLMAADGAGDSREEALAYMEATIGGDDLGGASTRERREAFVDSVGDVVRLLQGVGLEFSRAADYPDYYPERPGGKIGRSLEVEPFDAKRVGEWWDTSRGQDGLAFPLKTDDVWLLSRAWSTPGGFARGARFVGRALASVVRGQRLVGGGAALACAMLEVVLRQGTSVWLSAPVVDLVVEDGAVTGAIVQRGGDRVTVRTRRGVVLAGGGFAHREEWRKQHHGVPGWSSANPGNVGTAIEVGQRAGGAVALMDDAWWGPAVPAAKEGGSPMFIVADRSMPFTIIVDARGDRFANESESYVDFAHRMLQRGAEVDGPFWMISDVRHGRRYLRSYVMEPGAAKSLAEAGMLHREPTLDALARATGMDPGTLQATVERFNGFARTGVDQDFGRGNSAYDRYYGDPLNRPNPNLGPLEKGPFTAVRLVPGDLGTKGGLLTDADGRVLREDRSPIEGLYASGNTTASVMGRTYPGAGATLGPAIVFGARAAWHLARQPG